MKTIENELSTMISNYEKLQRDHTTLNEDLTKSRHDLEQIEKSDISHKERVSQMEQNKKKMIFILKCYSFS